MVCFASSAMDDIISSDCLINWLTFWRCGCVHKTEVCWYGELDLFIQRHIILLIDNLLLINVYLPCTYTADREDEYV